MKNYNKLVGGKIKNIIEDLSKYCEETEVFFKVGKSKAVFFARQSNIESSLSEENGMAIRFWKDNGSEYFFHCSDDGSGNLSRGLIEKIEAFSCREKGHYSPRLAEKKIPVSDLNIFCKDTSKASNDRLSDFLSDTVQYLEEKWKGVIRVNSGELRAGFSENWLSNSKGFSGHFQRTMASISMNCHFIPNIQEKEKGSSGKIQSFYITSAHSSILNINPADLLRDFEIIAERISLISSDKTLDKEEKNSKVVFSSLASSELLRILFDFLHETQKKPFSLSDKLTIVDDGRLKGGLGSGPFDGAGFPSRKTIIMQNGRLIHWFENMIRSSYRDYPSLGPSNLFIKPGEKSQKEIVDRVAKGVYIISIKAFSNPRYETNTSLLCQGFLIEQGKVSPFVGKFIIATEVTDIFRNILEIGNDLQFIPLSGPFGAPTILAEKIRLLALG